jgi:hypothetical protein
MVGYVQQTNDLMTHPTPDANGTISWQEAIRFVWNSDQDLNFLPQFAQDYSHLCGERIDLGELEVWYSDLAVAVIADLVFGG